jgi:anti-sigma-K factor RskA
VNCEEVRELTGAYVLGALDVDEMHAVEQHLAECSLHPEIAGLRATAGLLVLATTEREPPAALRDRILLQARGPAMAPLALKGRHRTFPAWPVAALLAMLAIGLLAWNLTLIRGRAPEAAVRAVTSGPAAGTQLRFLPRDHVAILEVAGLSPTSADRVYQAWAIHGSEPPRGVGLFTVSPEGKAHLVLSAEVAPGDVIAVTVEPAGGSAAPTSQPIFLITI